ncbi:MAG: Crp/Fnr family transcriptional regulator, partial [Thermodesulfobacteriota bacterium]
GTIRFFNYYLMDKKDILKKYQFYNEAEPTQQEEYEQRGNIATLHAGDFYFHEGDSCRHVALIGEGDIRVYKSGASGREVTLYHVGSGETCTLTASCILANINYPATAVAESETVALLYPAAVFREWIITRKEIQSFVFQALASRMSTVMSLVEEITFNKMDCRVAEYLLHRFTKMGNQVSTIQSTHEQIASELGSAREVISRILQEFKRLGAIELARKQIIIKDIEKLHNLAQHP